MRVIRLIVPLLWIPLTLGAQVPYQTPVVAIEVRGVTDDTVTAAIPIVAGDLLTPEALKSAIQALYDTGGYRRITVEATPEADGIRLIFDLIPPYFFSTVRMEPDDVLERPLSSYVSLPYGQRFSESEVQRVVDDLTRQLQAEGYFAAEVTPSWEFDDERRLVMTRIHVEAGTPAQVGRIRFGGTQETLTPAELLDLFEVRTGDRFIRAWSRDGAARIRERFTELLFLNTRADVAETYVSGTNTVDLDVSIQPGPLTFVDVRGYDEWSSEELRELIPVYEEGRFDPELIEEGRLALAERLRREGYAEARVQSEVFEAPFDDAYQINYLVEPGLRYTVRSVLIEGNTFFSNSLMVDRIGIASGGWFRRGVFSPELLAQAEDTIRRLYATSGFTGTTVRSVREVDGNQITVRVLIDEGQRLEVGDLYFFGLAAISEAELRTVLRDVFSGLYTPAVSQNARRALIAYYHRYGYPDVEVAVSVTAADADRMDLTFRIDEGDPSRISQIFVAGNTRTRDRVVRRNSTLSEGTPYNPESILEAQRRLYATGLFNRVDIVTLERPNQRERDVLIQLEDAGAVVLTYGVGVQDREGPRGTVEVTHSNLWGLDRSISARIRGSRREQRFQTTYREPRLFNRELDGFASLFVERASRQFYDANRVDFSIQSLKQFANDDSLLISASYQTVNLRDIRVNPRTATFPDEIGIIQIARLGGSYVRDNRDDPLNPRRGNYFTGSLQLANRALGSEVNFVSTFTQFSMYRPADRAVLAGSVRLGWNQPYGVTRSLPITERYFAGGSTTLRGFGLDDAGPEGGGNALMIVNAEYRFPIPFIVDGLWGAGFYDTGTTFAHISDFSVGDFTHTAGFGLRYQTPLGPIRVDWGINLNRQPDEAHNKAFFTLGHAF